MEDFMTDIKGHLRHIYDQFQLGDFNDVEGKLNEYLARNQRLDNGAYEVHQDSIDIVNDNFLDIMQILGYNEVSSNHDLVERRT